MWTLNADVEDFHYNSTRDGPEKSGINFIGHFSRCSMGSLRVHLESKVLAKFRGAASRPFVVARSTELASGSKPILGSQLSKCNQTRLYEPLDPQVNKNFWSGMTP